MGGDRGPVPEMGAGKERVAMGLAASGMVQAEAMEPVEVSSTAVGVPAPAETPWMSAK